MFAQVIGSVAAGYILFQIASGSPDFAIDPTAPGAFAIGLALTRIHLVNIPVTNTSVNPARSTGVALFAGSGAIGQLWMFWLAPILGGLIGGFLYKWLGQGQE